MHSCWFASHLGSCNALFALFGICFKQHFDTRYLVFYNPSPPRMFLSLDLHSEYRIQHEAIGPLYVTSSYSTWIFCKGVSGFAIDCPCDVWCRRLTTCCGVGLTFWVVYLHFFFLAYAIIYVLIHHIIFWLCLYFLNILYFFKLSCTNNFHKRSLCTFFSNSILFPWHKLLAFWNNYHRQNGLGSMKGTLLYSFI